ncbi:Scramblase-domain-containing protein [Phlebopus sp. FC_14]|nr:Scramblase-domain-containing protein [Phlebopus sp. FC_14]
MFAYAARRQTFMLREIIQHQRTYALSRFPLRSTGFGRSRRRSPRQSGHEDKTEFEYGERHTFDDSQFWGASACRPTGDPEVGLKRLLLTTDTLVVTRQLEMLNVFLGFEQSNRYVISNAAGEPLGYIAEEPRGVLSMLARQVFRTHRPFRALVMDLEGSPVLWVRRPFAWINSRMFVQRLKDFHSYTPEGEPVLDTFAEVQQQWHLWRRRYDLFLKSSPRRTLTALSSPQPELTPLEAHFNQFALVDEGLWAWHFVLKDARGEGIASIGRAFKGLGREIFTDTGQYLVSFNTPEELGIIGGERTQPSRPSILRELTLDERALVLATAVNIDYDYFSRHSEGGHGMGLPIWWSSGGE